MRTVLFLLAVFYASVVLSSPYAVMNKGGVVITLNDDPCTLPFLTDSYKTAKWEQEGKVFNGCWTVNGLGIVLIWMNDKSMSGVPGYLFKRVEAI